MACAPAIGVPGTFGVRAGGACLCVGCCALWFVAVAFVVVLWLVGWGVSGFWGLHLVGCGILKNTFYRRLMTQEDLLCVK